MLLDPARLRFDPSRSLHGSFTRTRTRDWSSANSRRHWGKWIVTIDSNGSPVLRRHSPGPLQKYACWGSAACHSTVSSLYYSFVRSRKVLRTSTFMRALAISPLQKEDPNFLCPLSGHRPDTKYSTDRSINFTLGCYYYHYSRYSAGPCAYSVLFAYSVPRTFASSITSDAFRSGRRFSGQHNQGCHETKVPCKSI